MSFAAVLSGNFYYLKNSFGSNYSYRLLKFNFGLAPGKAITVRTDNLRLLVSKAEVINQKSANKNPCNFNLNFRDGLSKSSSTKSLNKAELHELKAVQCYNLQHSAEGKIVDSPAVIIVFDIETTGLSRDKGRIIEIAFRSLCGGKNSTFQSLVNPEQNVPNAYIHGIKSHMVNRPDIPRYFLVEISVFLLLNGR